MSHAKHAISLVLLAVWLTASPALAEDKYTMEDLTALAEQENWSELLAHLGDIRPSMRKGVWNKLLSKAAIGHLDGIEKQGSGYMAVLTSDDFLLRFPKLKKSKEFMKKRAAVGMKGFKECFSNRYAATECLQQVLKFVEADAKNSDLAFEAAKMTRRYNATTSLYLFNIATKSKKDRAARCKDSELVIAVQQGFGGSTSGKYIEGGRDVVFKNCWKQLKEVVLEQFYDGNTYVALNVCSGLKKKKVLTAFQKAYCKDAATKK